MARSYAVEIQPASESDVDAVWRLANEWAFPGEPTEESGRAGFLVSDFTLEDYRELLVRADHFYVARKYGKVVGFVLGYGHDRIESDEWLNNQVKQHLSEFVVIKQVCVDPGAVSQGIASMLYERVLERCSHVPVVAAVVSDPPNEPSTRLHRRHGFQPFLSLTPPDKLPRTVWMRRRYEVDALLVSYGTATQLYLHEDDLNWRKLHHFLYVTVGLFAAFGFVLSAAGGEDSVPLTTLLVAIPGIGMTSVLTFGISLYWGVRYMEARKDALGDVEGLLVRAAGGAPVVTKTTADAREGWLRRSPTRFTLRTIPVVVGLCWVGAAITAFAFQ